MTQNYNYLTETDLDAKADKYNKLYKYYNTFHDVKPIKRPFPISVTKKRKFSSFLQLPLELNDG